MTQTVIDLTKELISMRSVTRDSNVAITERIQAMLEAAGFEIERIDYVDDNGIAKANLIAKLGTGSGGLAFCSHTDTVPGQEHDWPAFDPFEEGDLLYGRGSCDMKGPLAATLVASLAVDPATLKQPIYIVCTADEEIGLKGAKFVAENSEILRRDRPEYGVIAEPSRMVPVYAHKGFVQIVITAHGRAAHTSTGLGESATLKIAPMLADLAELNELYQTDPSYQNEMFTPPTNGLNVTINDGNIPTNVTAAKTQLKLSIRGMPNSRSEDVRDQIVMRAKEYGLDVESEFDDSLYCDPESDLIQSCLRVTGAAEAETVAYGTDGTHLQKVIDKLVILGPGDIAVAHTIEEHVPMTQLVDAVDVYTRLIDEFCK